MTDFGISLVNRDITFLGESFVEAVASCVYRQRTCKGPEGSVGRGSPAP